MIGWLKYLFGSLDRQQKAAERTAKALEDIADATETMRDQLLLRLRGEPLQLATATEPAEEDEEEKPQKKEKKR